MIFGYFAIFLGLLWIVWPQLLRGWAAGKASWVLFIALIFPFFFPAIHWAGQWGMRGQLGACGAFLAFYWLLQKGLNRASQVIPLLIFRVAGLLNILFGVWVVWFKKPLP